LNAVFEDEGQRFGVSAAHGLGRRPFTNELSLTDRYAADESVRWSELSQLTTVGLAKTIERHIYGGSGIGNQTIDEVSIEHSLCLADDRCLPGAEQIKRITAGLQLEQLHSAALVGRRLTASLGIQKVF
jgi:hypothetical protein